MSKMVVMVCYQGPIYGQTYATVYGKRMTRECPPHHVMQHRSAVCEECGAELAGLKSTVV